MIAATIAVWIRLRLKESACTTKHRPSVSGLGATRLREVSPPDLPSLNPVHPYQVSFSRDFSWARCNPESTFAGYREYTSFSRSVIAFPSCCFRNSAIALAYSSLLETRSRRAVASARRKSSSGIETAVFMLTVQPKLYQRLLPWRRRVAVGPRQCGAVPSSFHATTRLSQDCWVGGRK